jgi:pSer/pThr/pTyr-binding forkhead associated (FHA) protein
MVTRLIVSSGKSAGRMIAIKRNRLLIGRADECDVRPLSDEVSRRHCAVVVGPAEVWVEDLGSRNGTFVNGVRITEKTRVSDGDMIRVGALELKVSCNEPATKGGTEDDVSRWLMADDRPAGMFDTTQSLPMAGGSAGAADPRGGHAAATDDSSLVAGIGAAPPAGPLSGDTIVGRSTTTTTAIEALKAANARPGGLPSDPRKPDSSRDAAAEALRRFFEKH